MTGSYEDKLKQYIAEHHILAEHLSFVQSCHSVAEAAQAARVTPQDFIKSICMLDETGRLVVAIVKGEDRASTGKTAQAAGVKSLRLATPDEMLLLTGYPCGGTPPFGFPAVFLMDERVFEKDVVYGGGGSENSLVRIAPDEMRKANGARIEKVRK